jgi:hypothetical protein
MIGFDLENKDSLLYRIPSNSAALKTLVVVLR